MNKLTKSKLKKKFIEILATGGVAGNISTACNKLGISRQTYYDWKESDHKFKEQIEVSILEGKHSLADQAESALYERILKGDTTAIIFTLKSLKRQLYGEDSKGLEELKPNVEKNNLGEPKSDRDARLMFSLSMIHLRYRYRNWNIFNSEQKIKFEEILKTLK